MAKHEREKKTLNLFIFIAIRAKTARFMANNALF